MRLALLCLMLAQLGVPASESITDNAIVWWVAPALAKVRPVDQPPVALQQSADISAAQNEFEPFQIVLRSRELLKGIDVQASPLTDRSGNTIPPTSIQIYLVACVNVPRPSRIGGERGEWPDILIPRTDIFFHERRNAFPFQLPRGRNQSVWIDIYVPSGTRAGLYQGKVTLTMEGREFLTVPVRLNVWNFALPSTSSLTTSFGFNGLAAHKLHAGKYISDDDIRSLTFLYSKAALLDRISLHGGSFIPPPFTINENAAAIDWKLYDQEVGPFLDGKVLGDKDPLPGARATSVDLRTNGSADTDEKKILYWREWAKHFRARGWLNKLFYYVLDEPKAEDYPKIVNLSRLAHQADPAIRTMVTLQKTAMLDGAIDLWSPLINCFELKPGFDAFCRETVARNGYADIPPGRDLWWYQSCASHGCFIEGGPYFKGWPSYMIDDSAVSNRVMPWFAWKYRINGELYFSTNEAYSQTPDPWANVYLYGGNGDGTLFYPGRPARIGGTRDIPIDSVRLKLIREGLEDYEYLRILERATSRDAVARQVDRVVQNLYTFTSDPRVLSNSRMEIGGEIEKLAPAMSRDGIAGGKQ